MNVNGISSTDYQLYLQKLKEEQKSQNMDVVSTTQQIPSFSQDMDSFIPSEQNDDSQTAIPSQQYGDMRPPMPPMAPPMENGEETTASTATTASTVSTDSDSDDTSESSSILSSISSVMRVNKDSIEAAMDKFGISEDDLTDEDTLTELLDELQNGATSRGLGSASESEIANLIASLTDDSESSETTAEETVSTELKGKISQKMQYLQSGK